MKRSQVKIASGVGDHSNDEADDDGDDDPVCIL